MSESVKLQDKRKIRSLKKLLTPEMFLTFLIIVVLLFLLIVAPQFYDIANIMTILRVFSYVFIAGIGMTMIIITGNIDISFGAVVSVIAIVCAAICKASGLGILLFLPIGMLIGALLCGLNAIIITKFRIPSIVVTLATMQIYYGALLLTIDGSIYGMPNNWTWFSFDAKLFGVLPLSVIIALVLLVAAILFFKYSKFLKKLYAIGNNAQGAKYAGINVNKTMIIMFLIAGALLGISAVILGTNGNRVTSTVGNNFEMLVIAAVIVGGTSAIGGSGKIYGTALGSLLLAIVSPALVFLKINTYWTDFFTGFIIVVAIIISVVRYSKRRINKSTKYIGNSSEEKAI
jgi:ribose/xylose/arabinose/galactoside ABC-type transport system permease subunit